MVSEERNIRVLVRVRPHNRRELEQNQRTIIKVLDKDTLLFDPDEEEDEFFFQGVKQGHRDITKRTNKKLSMEFDRIFSEDEDNELIFEESTKPLVASVMGGYNCSVFVYGATGAGKTFTMLGSEDCAGLTLLTMEELFNQINSFSETRKFDIGITYLEVYNEQVMNLLTKAGPLKLREDSNGVVVSGLVLRPIYNAKELINLLMVGNKNRTQHPTDSNAESSRSHAVFQVHIRMTEKKTGQKRTVKLSMIDLAGSERAASTKGIGVRFKEGASINKSLLALGNCINKLADGSKHIPYRDSNLTRLLKDSLGGNCQTVMIANVSPSSLTFEDTYNTLKYASRAKKIRIVLKQNIMRTNMPKDYFVKKVTDQQSEIDRLTNLNKALEAKLQQQQQTGPKEFDESIIIVWYGKIDVAYSALIKAQDMFLNVQSKERILKFRAKLKKYAEEGKRALSLDGLKLNEEIARMDASIDRFGKQVEKMKDELSRCRKRYSDAQRDIVQLRNECESSNCAKVLAYYFKAKEYEVDAFKNSIKNKHIKEINTLYDAETVHLRKSLLLSCKMIQRNYLLLRANNIVDSEFTDNLDRLAQLNNGQPDIRFCDENRERDDDEKPWTSLSLEGITQLSDVTDVVETNPMKRSNDDDDNDNCSEQRRNRKLFKAENTENMTDYIGIGEIKSETELFKLPAMKINLNETQVIRASTSNSQSDDINTTFQISATNNQQNTEIIKSILTEQSVNATNRAALSKALIKSNVAPQKIFNKVSLAVSKENKKFSPNKIRKSPRPVSRNVTNRALTSAANFINRQRTKSQTNTDGGDSNNLVRVNRTASMRLKKT